MNFKQYQLRFAQYEDIEDIMKFIKTEWNESHILANSRKFFEYEYLNKDNSVNFALAFNTEKKCIDAIHAFYQYGLDSKDYFGGLWKAKKSNVPLLGVMLKKFLYDNVDYRSFSAVGSNPNTTIPIQQMLKFHTGKLSHFYMLNNKSEYKVAVVRTPKKRRLFERNSYRLVEFMDFDHLKRTVDFSENTDVLPFKSSSYIEHRYFHHPVYLYRVFGIFKEEISCNSFIVAREIEQNSVKVLRIVDYIGSEEILSCLGHEINRLLIEDNYEYIDFYCTGIKNEILNEAGFEEKTLDDGNIIPNYFEPFVQKNVDIYYHTTTPEVRICKADSDQDRPNSIGVKL